MKKVRIDFWIKTFITGTIAPALLYPIVVALGAFYPSLYDLSRLWWIPFFMGLWNVLYFLTLKLKKRYIKDRVLRLTETGAVVGLVLAIIVVLNRNLHGIDLLIRIVAGPLIGALIWRYFTAYFNHLFGLED